MMKKNLVLSPKKYTRIRYISEFSTNLDDKIAIQELRVKIMNTLGKNITYANVLGAVNIFCMRKNLNFYKIVFHPDRYLYAIDKKDLDFIVEFFYLKNRRMKFFNKIKNGTINNEKIAAIMQRNGLTMSVVRGRFYRGWDLEKCIFTPKKGIVYEKN